MRVVDISAKEGWVAKINGKKKHSNHQHREKNEQSRGSGKLINMVTQALILTLYKLFLLLMKPLNKIMGNQPTQVWEPVIHPCLYFFLSFFYYLKM